LDEFWGKKRTLLKKNCVIIMYNIEILRDKIENLAFFHVKNGVFSKSDFFTGLSLRAILLS